MNLAFEELDFQTTPLGEISLRRRSEPRLNNVMIYEVKLGEEFLMTSLFTESEIQLAKLGLAAVQQHYPDTGLNIVVGGLGLGYTAATVLEDNAVNSLSIIEVMQPVIDWHKRGLVPLGKTLSNDPRCEFIHADFFALVNSDKHSLFEDNDMQAHAILLDIDHSPTHWLNDSNQSFYSVACLNRLADKLLPKGIFTLWSNDPVDKDFMQLLGKVFDKPESHIVSFPNPYTDGKSSCTVYLATNR